MMITDALSFGAALRERRKQRGYTQADLSAATGVSVSFLSDLENGKETTELGKALFIAQMLGLDLSLTKRERPV